MEILITEISTEGNETRANITGLQPGMKFRIQVAGISNITDSNFIALGQSASLWVNTSRPGKMIIIMYASGCIIHGTTCLFQKLFTHGQVLVLLTVHAP